jgi:hypothetical protein
MKGGVEISGYYYIFGIKRIFDILEGRQTLHFFLVKDQYINIDKGQSLTYL